LVVAEVAIALALVICSGLVIRSYLALASTPLGIRSSGVYETGAVRLSTVRYSTPQSRSQAEQRLLTRVKALPGVDAAALAFTYPLGGFTLMFFPEVFGRPHAAGQNATAMINAVSPDYFRALGIPLLQGRTLADGDSLGSPAVVVNQAFADKFLQGTNPVTQRLVASTDNGKTSITIPIVGVVANTRGQLTAPPSPTLYVPMDMAPTPYVSVVVHTTHTDLLAAQEELQHTYAQVFPEYEPPAVYAVSNLVAKATETERSAATLLGALAVVPLLLALFGIFAVVSFSVGQRSGEFGIRMALGAQAQDILADVLRRSLLTTAIGVAIGTVLAALAARAIAPRIHVPALDPVTFGFVIGMVVLCAAFAALLPALRATRVDPIVALRYE